MNLFWKKLFGKLQTTAKYEENERTTLESMNRYYEVEKSAELAEYKKLFQQVKSGEFKENKKMLLHRRYKDTEEYRDMRKYSQMLKDKGIKQYFTTLKSEDFMLFQSFEKTPEFADLGDKKKVETSERLKKIKNFETSKEYQNFLRFKDSYIIKEFEELKEKISTSEFKKANGFWENPRRWETTTEYQQELRYFKLADNPDIKFYNNENADKYTEFHNRELTFNSEFDLNTIDQSKWQFGFHYPHAKLIGNHSFANEKQANNDGKNTVVEDGLLKILTKHQTVKTTAWDTQKGFVEKTFEYTSDVLQTADAFRQKGGVFQAKIRCSGNIHHAFWLGADNKLPHINIFYFNGKNITVGNASKDVFDGATITGINPATPYIYTLKWEKNELIWYINNLEVYRTIHNVPQEALYIAINSFITARQHGSSGSIEIDWIRVYKTV